jgi:hypothetical protein
MHYNALFLYETWDIVRRIVLRYAHKSVTQRSTEEKSEIHPRCIKIFNLFLFFGLVQAFIS